MLMNRLITLTLLFIVFSTSAVDAQSNPSNRISGEVVNVSGEALSGVSVYLIIDNETNVILKTAVSDGFGAFEILHVPSGHYFLELSYVGYGTKRLPAFEYRDGPLALDRITLEESGESIDEVTVSRELPLIQNRNGKLVMNVENSTLAAGNNALDVLKRAPGVSIDQDNNILLMGREGINVTVDGRQTFMSGEQLANFLKSLDANQIKDIEVGTTRNASEDAEGAAGRINIVLKKNNTEGFNGNFTASAAHGMHARGNTSLALNYKKGATTTFGTYAYTHNKEENQLDLYRLIGGDAGTAFDQTASMVTRTKTHNYRFGVEQKTSERNTMLFQISGIIDRDDDLNHSLTAINQPSLALDSTLTTNTDAFQTMNRFSFNANNEFKIDTLGSKLTFDADVTLFRNNGEMHYEYLMRDAAGQLLYDPEYERNSMPVDIDIYVGRLDYVKNFGASGQLEAGLKYSNVRSDNDMQFEHFVDQNWQNFVGRSNHFIYTEQVAAAYADYSYKVGKWDFEAGLRAERTSSHGRSVTLDDEVKRNYLDLFPSVSLTYSASQNHIFNLSYSKKISRPNYRNLNPFEYYVDRFTFNKGNPYLQPQYTHGLALNYTLMQMFNVSLGSDLTLDALTEFMGQDEETKRTWITRENLGRQVTSYMNVNAPYRFGKFWMMSNNLLLAHMYFKGQMGGLFIDQGAFMFQLNTMNTFKISNRISAEASLRYMSPFLYNIYNMQRRWGLDAGLNYNFKDQKSSLKLAVTDVFRTNWNNISTRFNVFHSDIRQYNDHQAVRLTYSLKFGNLKQSVRRSTTSEESQRAQ